MADNAVPPGDVAGQNPAANPPTSKPHNLAPHNLAQHDARPMSPAMANYAAVIFFFVMLLNLLDRLIIAVVAEPIKQELGISDTQIGLMTGLSFAVFYTGLAIPLAVVADNWNRSKLIALSVTIWSAMTMMCGLASSFLQLFLARIGVGIGEAGASPPIHSLVADIFPIEKRGTVLGLLGTSAPIGSFLAYVAGGWVVQNLDWRVAFFIAGVPGLIVGVLMWFTVRDPRGSKPLSQAFKRKPGQATVKEAFAELSKKPAYWYIVATGVVIQFVAYGLGSFHVSFFARVHGLGYAEIGLKLGLVIGIGGAIGAAIGGRVGDWLARKNIAYPLYACGIVLAGTAPAAIAGFYVEDTNLSFICFLIYVLGPTFYYGPTFAAVQSLATDRTRAMAVAIYLMVASIIGLGFGPVFVGRLSDMFVSSGADSAAALQKALAILFLFTLGGLFAYVMAARRIHKDVAAAADTPAVPQPA